jgi:hypothetical protein
MLTIVTLRCEVCKGSIEADDKIIAFKYNGLVHIAHNKCFLNNTEDKICKEIDSMSERTREDSEGFKSIEKVINGD